MAIRLKDTASVNISGSAGLSSSATKATQDAEGNVITSTYATKSELTSELSGKVDKDGSKVLSTNDFTTDLKTKLEGLSNYDDTALTTAVNNLTTRFNTLLETDTTAAIESFNEIIAFLNGIADTETLEGIIAGIESQISTVEGKIPTKVSQLTNDSGYIKNTAVATSSELGLIKSGGDITVASDGTVSVTDNSHAHTIDNITGLQTALNSKASTAVATTTSDGLMSKEDKVKLDELSDASGEPNQNAFSNIKVGDTTIEADSKTDTLELVAGTNITLTPDATNDKVTISATDTNTTYTFAGGTNKFTVTPSGGSAQEVTVTPSIANNVTGSGTSGYLTKFNGANTVTNGPALGTSTTTYLRNDGTWATPTNTTYDAMSSTEATTGTATTGRLITAKVLHDKITERLPDAVTTTEGDTGLMTAADKSKLDGIAAGANKYTHPTYTAKSSGLYKITVDGTGHVSGTTAVAKADITALGIPGSDTTYSSKAAASGGTDVSLVTTGEKATWNAKTSNTGTVTSVATGVGLTGGSITTSGTVKAKLRSETALTVDSAAATTTSGRVYPVAVDKSGYLSVNVPWTDTNTNTTYSAGTGLSLSGTTFSVNYGTTAGTACQGNDSRLSNARPASDVYSWAKASSKPTYTYSEVGAAPASHTHNYAGSSSAGGAATNSNALNGLSQARFNTIYHFSHHDVHICLGTLTLPQSGNGAIIRILTGWGYNATLNQQRSSTIFMRAANGNPSENCYYAGCVEHDSQGGYPIYVVQNSSTSFTLWTGKTYYTGNSLYTVSLSSGSGWTHSGSSSSSLPSGAIELTSYQKAYTTSTVAAALKLGSSTVGSSTQPIYLNGGTATACSYTLGKSVPSNAVFTDTTYSAATQSAAGLMSAADKKKLDGVATGANAYSLPLAASGTRGGIQLGYSASGANIPVAVSSEKAYVALTKTAVTTALGYTPPTSDTNTHWTTRIYAGASGTAANAAATSPYIKITDDNTYRNQIRLVGGGATTVTSDANGNITISSTDNNTTYSAATTSANGLMTAAMVTKLNGIATGANAYSLPTATSSVLGGVKIGSNITVSSGTISLSKSNVTTALGYTPPTTNTTYSVATTSANGLMSSTDKSRLDYMHSSQAVTTLASLPAKSIVTATLSAATSISLASALTVGQSITVICTPSASFTQPIPTSGSFISLDGDSLKVTSGKQFEINILCYASSKYSISCKTAV